MNKLTLPLSISSLIEKIGNKKDLSPSQIISFIKEANIQAQDLAEWSDFDHDINEGYGRKLIYQHDHYEIMVMSWAAYDATAIHDHGSTDWGAVQVFGELEHVTYDLEDSYLTIQLKEKLSDQEVIYVNNDLIHRMINHSNRKVFSLHVYGTNKKTENVTADAKLYNVSTGEVQLVDWGVFHDLKEDEYTATTIEFDTDRLTQIEHYTQLLQHYYKTSNKGLQYRNAVNYFHDRSFESRLITELEMDSKRVLYFIELKKARKMLRLLGEDTRSVDSILAEMGFFGRFS